MAKNDPAPKKPRWYQLIGQAYRSTAPHDKLLLPIILISALGPIALGVLVGLLIGNTIALVYCIIFGVLVGTLLALFMLTKRFEKTAFGQMEGVVGGSLAVAQSIRSGWEFDDAPQAMDPKGRAVVFRGVGKTGIVLLAEGGGAAHRLVDDAKKRLNKLIPGVPIRAIYVGKGANEVPISKIVREIRKGKTVLSRGERAAVSNRLRAIGGAKLPVPKGVDPLRARPDRKALKGK
ncbi:DUF4191 domain-containing protein [Demequina sp.]|uniref:DUF4191 domain-containing protein n=1 Tax=Demequina sp. TaxID=2050685 RepID=UPI003D117BF9